MNLTTATTTTTKSSDRRTGTTVDCVPGESFPRSSDGSCAPCSECPNGSRRARGCSNRRGGDTVCSCIGKVYFHSVARGSCQPCSTCARGWGVWRQCFRNRNTVCRRCPRGTYSGTISSNHGCFLCQTCTRDQLMLQECSAVQDTVCIDRSVGQMKHFTNELGVDANSRAADLSAVPVYFTLIAVVLCGLLGYVVFKWRLRNLVKGSSMPRPNEVVGQGSGGGGGAGQSVVSYAPLHSSNLRRPDRLYPTQPSTMDAQRPGSQRYLRSNLVYNQTYHFPVLNAVPTSKYAQSVAHPYHESTAVRYCDITSTKMRALEGSLNPRRSDARDWKGLGRELGYANGSLDVFEGMGAINYGPTRHLLSDWSKSDSATVVALVKGLLKVGRFDSAMILDPNVRSQATLSPGFLV